MNLQIKMGNWMWLWTIQKAAMMMMMMLMVMMTMMMTYWPYWLGKKYHWTAAAAATQAEWLMTAATRAELQCLQTAGHHLRLQRALPQQLQMTSSSSSHHWQVWHRVFARGTPRSLQAQSPQG
jgi:hypothetical protein